ncbi:thioredoxin [Candidatus Thiodictyon syntrophicum]|jgi:putative thioredoxin|uniref:Thioredoxin n=1 Tax=Candidatus Thiodictyon syntrophicum TaxID=1166950 RepID=A0A2K8U5X0_9GAMM|nr:thioredoxin [Candidatus Thiodictyon syntrophicum]AUB80982.1 thioredoxin [Candidatus Thiodictyon syntrophicum]
MAQSPYIVTVTAANFEAVVIDGSFDRPVLVDFWADWCAPCKGLMPVLAKLADAYAGKFILAKVNTEEEQALAAHFGIRNLPTVQLFKSGQVVDQFMGALPEGQVREFLDRHLPQPGDGLLAQAQDLMAAGDLKRAAVLIEQAQAQDPSNARVALARVQLTAAQGDLSGAAALLERLPIELAQDPEVAALRGQLRFAQALVGAPAPVDLTRRLAADPNDSEAAYLLAAHRVLAGDFEGALEGLLALMKRDRTYGDDAARKGMVAVFDLLGGQGELVTRFRARMMTVLY